MPYSQCNGTYVIEFVIPVNQGLSVIYRNVVPELLADGFEFGNGALGFGHLECPLELLAPSIDLSGRESSGTTVVAESDCLVIDRMDRGERIDQFGSDIGLMGRRREPLDLLVPEYVSGFADHDVEFAPDDRRILTREDGFGDRNRCLLKRIDRPVFAENVVSGVCCFLGRRPADHELTVIPLDQQRFVRVALIVAQFRESIRFTEDVFRIGSYRVFVDESIQVLLVIRQTDHRFRPPNSIRSYREY